MVYYDTATRAQALTLKLIVGLDNKQIEAITGLKSRTINDLVDKALERGFDPQVSSVILDKYVCDAPKAGRPSKKNEHKDTVLQKLGSVISPLTIWRILCAAGMQKTKPTRKPGLTEKMGKNGLSSCLRYQHWTHQDLKQSIWSDETSVVLNHRRGRYRVWRTPEEKFVKSVI
ncbi:hypothetical protein N657DRAFT_376284 [Parathielavia appendiculata]|uniref:Transposase Tc1-like domain-containing protein n=1 Tax=Parathielavia appendiculata TaxID=2587402 RepID=A0AAN6U0L2_9PEZI|nr:hypothetical protein N657DRAFT_376284 [Parathielavia appendiculata]